MTEYQKYQLQWMIDHGFSLKNLIHELDKLREESDQDEDLESIFADWEYGYGFGSEIWACEAEWRECEGMIPKNLETFAPHPTETIVLGFSLDDIDFNKARRLLEAVKSQFPENAVIAIPNYASLKSCSKGVLENIISMISEIIDGI